MPASFEEILNSRIFKFTVGQNVDGEATTFSVHEEAIAALSQPLHTLMRSGLSESETGHATWEDVGKDTFVRFAQFAYTGDYSVPVLELKKIAPPPLQPVLNNQNEDFAFASETDAILEPVDDWAESGTTWGASRKVIKKKVVREQPMVADIVPSTPFPILSPRNNHKDTCEPSSSFEPGKSYSGAFISHASLWILGDYRHVESLKALALYKLHKTLYAFRLSASNVDEVVDLVRFAYSEEGAGLGEGISGLRRLVCQYLAKSKTLLCRDENFMELLGEGGQLVKDFFRQSTIAIA